MWMTGLHLLVPLPAASSVYVSRKLELGARSQMQAIPNCTILKLTSKASPYISILDWDAKEKEIEGFSIFLHFYPFFSYASRGCAKFKKK